MKRFQYTSEFFGVVINFRAAFSKRSWPYFLAITLHHPALGKASRSKLSLPLHKSIVDRAMP